MTWGRLVLSSLAYLVLLFGVAWCLKEALLAIGCD